MSTAWKKRSLDEARALGGNLNNAKSSRSNSEDFDDEETRIKKKTNTYQSHLKLVQMQVAATSAPIASLEATTVNNVDIRTAGATKHNGFEATSTDKSDRKQQKISDKK